MIDLNRTKYRALRNMTRAIARGDVEAAGKWLLIFDAQLMVAKRLSDLERRRPRRNSRKRQKRRMKENLEWLQLEQSAPLPPPPPPPPPPKRTGPVMLDPEGFSPGGTPNWVLNNRRRERAGLEEPLRYNTPRRSAEDDNQRHCGVKGVATERDE